MLTIGLTGGVGSGKTTVTRHFSSLGVPVIDADDLARQLVERGEPAYKAIVEEFGREILTDNGDINRRKLRQLIFANSANRVILESILHPLVRQQIQQQIQSINAPYCIVAIPLLIETGQTDIVDRILVINAPKSAQISRTVARDGVTEEDVEYIISAQVSNDLRLTMADDVLENDAGLDDIYPKVKVLHEKYLQLAGVEKLAEEPEIVDYTEDQTDSEKSKEQQAPEMPWLEKKESAYSPSLKMSAETQVGVYELPLNEKMRTFIRLEFLFNEIEHYLKGKNTWDIRSAVNAFIATLNVLCRPELKTDLMKELDRLNVSLAKFGSHVGVNEDVLADLRNVLSEKARILRNHEGPLGQSLKQNELVTSLRQRESIPGGALAMDMPSYAHWLSKSFDECAKDIRLWLTDFMMVKEAVDLILSLIRDSAVATEGTAKTGFYQHAFDTTDASTQIVRIIVSRGVDYFPEISGGRHRFTVRFLKQSGFDRPVQADEDVNFKLICCSL